MALYLAKHRKNFPQILFLPRKVKVDAEISLVPIKDAADVNGSKGHLQSLHDQKLIYILH